MFNDLQAELITALKTLLGAKTRTIAPVPTENGEALLRRFGSDAPALYVVLMPGSIDGDAARVRFAVLCVTQDARSTQAARAGTGTTIGLHPLMNAVMTLGSGALNGWQATGWDFHDHDDFIKHDLQCGTVFLQVRSDLPQRELGELNDFLQLNAFVDIDPMSSEEDRNNWIAGEEAETQPDIAAQINLESDAP